MNQYDKMTRRDFLKFLGLAGIAASVPLGMAPTGNGNSYLANGGKLFVMIHAGGGWDPSSLTDPKGDGNGINRFGTGDIINQNGFRLAPNLINGASFDNSANSLNRQFLNRFANRLLVINGIDMQTNNHGVGPRHAWSGKLAEGYPTFNALLAAASASNLPLSFITNGGYQFTDGLIASSRVSNTGFIEEISQPNRYNNQNVFSSDTFQRIKTGRDSRQAAKEEKQRLPLLKSAMLSLTNARYGEADLNQFVDSFNGMTPFTGANVTNPFSAPEANRVAQLVNQFRVAWAAYQANICAAVNINIGGFDTHNNHDAMHFPRLAAITDALLHIDDIISATPGFDASNVFFAVSSDFGRTPRYNGGNGKDHWPINSMFFVHGGEGGLRTGTVGATDASQRALAVDASSFGQRNNGVIIRPAHIHAALRKFAGLNSSTDLGSNRTVGSYPLGLTAAEMNFENLIDMS